MLNDDAAQRCTLAAVRSHMRPSFDRHYTIVVSSLLVPSALAKFNLIIVSERRFGSERFVCDDGRASATFGKGALFNYESSIPCTTICLSNLSRYNWKSLYGI